MALVTLSEALQWGSERCRANLANPLLDARILLCHAAGVSREELLLHGNKTLNNQQWSLYQEFIARRLAHEPIAYITGKKEFYGLELIITKDVLIPRPETEMIIDLMLAELSLHPISQEPSILELGTGSGALAVSLAANHERANILATDISAAALKIARLNAQKYLLKERITFILSDWYQQIERQEFDYIISNPPYINSEEQEIMAPETRKFEPALALYANDDGSAAYKQIIAQAPYYLKPHGKIFLEIGYKQATQISHLLLKSGFGEITVHKDLAGHDRIIAAERT
jgi:release factor glutamine methyltransferase